MPIAWLRFDLADPDDAERHRRALEGELWVCAIQQYDNYLHNRLEHGQLIRGAGLELAAARRELLAELSARDLALWD